MLKLYDKWSLFTEWNRDCGRNEEAVAAKTGKDVTPQEAAKNTMAYNILAGA